MPWCVGGDFNVVRFPSEHLGAKSFAQVMHSFSNFISINGLMDIPSEGDSYTWSNSLFGSSIDQFLFSFEWEEHYPNIHQKWLIRVLSDHISRFLWRVVSLVTFIRANGLFILRTSGFKWMVLWRR